MIKNCQTPVPFTGKEAQHISEQSKDIDNVFIPLEASCPIPEANRQQEPYKPLNCQTLGTR